VESDICFNGLNLILTNDPLDKMSDYDSDSGSDSDSDYEDPREAWQRQARASLERPVAEGFTGGLNDVNILQPTTLQFTQYNTPKIVTVESQHRDPQIYPNPLSMRLMLPKVYKNVSRIDIVQVKFLCGLYALTATKRNTTLALFDSSFNRITVTIPDGTYGPSSLASTLSTALSSAGFFKYKVSFNSSTGRFNISSPGNPFRIPFRSLIGSSPYSDWGLGWTLGFGGAPVDLPASEIHTATMLPRLTTDYIYLRLNETENMNTVDCTGPENFAVSQQSSGLTNAYFGKLLLNDFGSYAQTFLESPKIFQAPLSRLDRITFNWLDKNGTAITGPDSLTCEWHMTLRIFEMADGPAQSSTIVTSQ
jgi:hypothetical protein